MKISVDIQRFDPQKEKHPTRYIFRVEAEPEDRLLDVLMKIKRFNDPTLTLRKSCGHGICGSDAMVINGQERLACKTLVKEVLQEGGVPITVEPLQNLPVQKDLMVDQSRFFERYRLVKPYFISSEKVKEKERIQSPEEKKIFDEGTKCILCAACYSACPVIKDINPHFLGPAAVVQASRFLDDSRDTGFEERLPQLDSKDGVWPCQNFFQCTRVCPRGIKITKLINQTKAKIKKRREAQGGKLGGQS